MKLHVLGGGVVKGLVDLLKEPFLADFGATIQGTFGAVGAMKEKLLAGQPCDVIILTASLIDELTRNGYLCAGSNVPVGRVRTIIAVPTSQALPNISDSASFKESLLKASAIYYGDPHLATAAIHFVKVLKKLGVYDALEARLRQFPNGTDAMCQMAQSTEAPSMGCAQITEISRMKGVKLAGALPEPHALSTVYFAAVCSKAEYPDVASHFVKLLSGDGAASKRLAAGFEL